MGDNVDVAGRSELYSSISTYRKGSKNKRKYLSEFPLDMIDVSTLSLTEFPRYELLEEKLRNTQIEIESLEARSDNYFREQEVDELDQDEWDDPVVCQLLELLTHNLLETFRSAIKKVVESGHSKEIAEQLILRSGLSHGTKDVVSNAVDGALAFVTREKELEASRHHVFEDLESLVNYTILEMITVVRELKPCLTVAEAMWWLLICDLNLLHACLVDRDHSGSFCIPEFSLESSLDPTIPSLKAEAPETSDANLNKSPTAKPSSSRGPLPDIPAIMAATQLSNSKISRVNDFANAVKETSVPSTDSRRKSLGTSREHVPILTQALEEEKASPNRKGSTGNSKRDMLRQKAFHFEKSYKGRMSKGGFKAKLTSWGSMVLDKALKSPSGSSGVVMKSTYSKITTSIGANSPLPSLPEGTFSVATNSTQGHSVLAVKETVFALPAVTSKSAPSSVPECISNPKNMKAQTNNSNLPVPDYFARIPYDESLGKYLPQDDKDETVLMLASHTKALEKEVDVWKDWANEKVMQATRRLSKDQMELKMLRQEKEEADKFKKERPALEEGCTKRLSEMEHAISNAAAQIEISNLSSHQLEDENNVLKIEAEAARLQALRASANCTEAMLKEQEALKMARLGDAEKISLQEELTTIKRQSAEWQQQLEKAETRKNQMEALWKQDEKERVNHQRQAELLRNETEQVKAQTKAEEEKMRKTDERNAQQYIGGIKKFEKEISELRLESDSSRIAALLGGVEVSYGNGGVTGASTWEGFRVPKVNKRLALFQDNFVAGSLRPERECVMCLSEEISVVFQPCAHQVLCVECNTLHEKQGMNDCPSCRTLIRKRIPVRYTDSEQP